ncbi:MAG: hypothetical protein HOE11_00955 [Candidatus Diapherotrites archaeon]|jgi:hypothetical protein|nr:hypothetical protein [Candidatus Diapherotrites archaeon]MBT4596542.1 hypothetical protein [Candidatus Diapherotrites archaeon]
MPTNNRDQNELWEKTRKEVDKMIKNNVPREKIAKKFVAARREHARLERPGFIQDGPFKEIFAKIRRRPK